MLNSNVPDNVGHEESSYTGPPVKEHTYDFSIPAKYGSMKSSCILAALSVNIRALVKKQSYNIWDSVLCSDLERCSMVTSLSIYLGTLIEKKLYSF
ncbi:hypothetical protein VTH82DRAFT_1798 [Thermothelomyces myriococcoides]